MSVDLSIIIPAYNCERYLYESVISLLNQDVSLDYEILVINDGSSDNTGYNVQSLDSKIRVYHLSRNSGPAVARAVGVQCAKGDILIFQDADDIALPNKISVLVYTLIKNKGVASFGKLLFSNSSFEFTDVNSCGYNFVNFDNVEILHDPLSRLFGQYFPVASISNMCTYRTYALKSCRIPSFFRVAEDYMFQLRLARFGAFVLLNFPTTICCSRPNSLTQQFKTLLQMGYSLVAAEMVYNELSDFQKRRYSKIMENRIKRELPFVFPAALLYGKFLLALRLLGLLRIYRVKFDKIFFKRLYWGVVKYKEEKFGK